MHSFNKMKLRVIFALQILPIKIKIVSAGSQAQVKQLIDRKKEISF